MGLSIYRSIPLVRLPPPIKIADSFQDVVEKRCSRRDFHAHNIQLDELSTLLSLAAGYKLSDPYLIQQQPTSEYGRGKK